MCAGGHGRLGSTEGYHSTILVLDDHAIGPLGRRVPPVERASPSSDPRIRQAGERSLQRCGTLHDWLRDASSFISSLRDPSGARRWLPATAAPAAMPVVLVGLGASVFATPQISLAIPATHHAASDAAVRPTTFIEQTEGIEVLRLRPEVREDSALESTKQGKDVSFRSFHHRTAGDLRIIESWAVYPLRIASNATGHIVGPRRLQGLSWLCSLCLRSGPTDSLLGRRSVNSDHP